MAPNHDLKQFKIIIRSYIYKKVISQEVSMILIHKMCSKIKLLKSQPHLVESYELQDVLKVLSSSWGPNTGSLIKQHTSRVAVVCEKNNHHSKLTYAENVICIDQNRIWTINDPWEIHKSHFEDKILYEIYCFLSNK